MTDRICYETGKPLPEDRPPTSHFMTTDERTAWNNRRKTRGAVLYDLFMASRYDRSLSKTLGLFAVMCKLASTWRAEDKAAGRVSHNTPTAESIKTLGA